MLLVAKCGMNVPVILLILLSINGRVCSFQQNSIFYQRKHRITATPPAINKNNKNHLLIRLRLAGKENDSGGKSKIIINGMDLKAELTAYLKKREEVGADEIAKSNVGKVIGGTKGNAILEYISGSPNKPYTISASADIFDYDELTKYGFGYLVTPIMDSGIGGRKALYELMDIPLPPARIKPKPKSAGKLVIDRTGESDKGRYSGLKVTQMIDDDEMGRKLEEVRKKQMAGKSLRKKLVEEDYEQPFADKRNTGPAQTPEWTPEMLDEEGRRAGKAIAWVEAYKRGEFKKDPYERMNIEGNLQVYSIFTALFVAFSFGNATPLFLSAVLGGDNAAAVTENILGSLQGLAFVLILNAILGSILCGGFFAPKLNRNGFVWGVKGLAGGPLAIMQLRELDALKTRGEIESEKAKVDKV